MRKTFAVILSIFVAAGLCGTATGQTVRAGSAAASAESAAVSDSRAEAETVEGAVLSERYATSQSAVSEAARAVSADAADAENAGFGADLAGDAKTEGNYTYEINDGKAAITAVSSSISGSISIPSTLGGAPVTAIADDAFSFCMDLTAVTIPDSVTSIGTRAFWRDEKLATVKMSANVTRIGNSAFSQCGALTSIRIPKGVTAIEDSAFSFCTSLTSVSLPNGLTKLGEYAFYGCSKLPEISIPDSVTALESGVFFGCTSLTNVRIPSGVKEIGANDFYGCTGLGAIEIPESVTAVDTNAFSNCSALADVYYTGSKTQWSAISVSSGNDPLKNAALHTGSSLPMFSDVTDTSSFLYKSVSWAAKNNIVLGYSDGTFRPGAACTRGQAFAFLWRLAGRPSPKTETSPFTDVTSANPFYKAILWGYENGYVKGYNDKTFRPDQTCSRSDIILFLWRYAGKPSSASYKKSFSDVPASASYYKAILWGASTGITSGYSDGTFRPSDKCTRGQIVQFLYRYAN